MLVNHIFLTDMCADMFSLFHRNRLQDQNCWITRKEDQTTDLVSQWTVLRCGFLVCIPKSMVLCAEEYRVEKYTSYNSASSVCASLHHSETSVWHTSPKPRNMLEQEMVISPSGGLLQGYHCRPQQLISPTQTFSIFFRKHDETWQLKWDLEGLYMGLQLTLIFIIVWFIIWCYLV